MHGSAPRARRHPRLPGSRPGRDSAASRGLRPQSAIRPAAHRARGTVVRGSCTIASTAVASMSSERVVPVAKAAEQHCLLFGGQPAFVHAGTRRVPEGLASSQPCQAEESAAAPGLRRMDPACEHVVERHDAAPGREPGVTRRLIAEGHGPPPNDAVGADHHVAPYRTPVGERDAHPPRLVDGGALAPVGGRRDQAPLSAARSEHGGHSSGGRAAGRSDERASATTTAPVRQPPGLGNGDSLTASPTPSCRRTLTAFAQSEMPVPTSGGSGARSRTTISRLAPRRPQPPLARRYHHRQRLLAASSPERMIDYRRLASAIPPVWPTAIRSLYAFGRELSAPPSRRVSRARRAKHGPRDPRRAGYGKSALLAYAVEHASGTRVLRGIGIESSRASLRGAARDGGRCSTWSSVRRNCRQPRPRGVRLRRPA
jgi:hypothetical protein